MFQFFLELCRRIETVPNQEKVQETRNPNSVVRPPIKDQKVKENNSTNNPITTENPFLREIAKKIDVAMPTIDELKIAQSLKFEDTDKLIKDLFQGNILISRKKKQFRFSRKKNQLFATYILISRKNINLLVSRMYFDFTKKTQILISRIFFFRFQNRRPL